MSIDEWLKEKADKSWTLLGIAPDVTHRAWVTVVDPSVWCVYVTDDNDMPGVGGKKGRG